MGAYPTVFNTYNSAMPKVPGMSTPGGGWNTQSAAGNYGGMVLSPLMIPNVMQFPQMPQVFQMPQTPGAEAINQLFKRF